MTVTSPTPATEAITADAVGAPSGVYWDRVLSDWEPTLAHRLWRAHSDAVNTRLLRRWLPHECDSALKTDLFDEAVGTGLYPVLAAHADRVVGVDVSGFTARYASERYPELEAVVGSVLRLPFPDRSFDVVVSNSTLDHFESRALVTEALRELARVLRPRGRLIVTLDNRCNPIIAARTSRRLAVLHRRLGIVPYYVGATLGAHGLSKALRSCGFEPQELDAVMHCPPQLAAELAQRLGRADANADIEQRHLRRALRLEAIGRWPTRHLTGHFVAALAVRVGSSHGGRM